MIFNIFKKTLLISIILITIQGCNEAPPHPSEININSAEIQKQLKLTKRGDYWDNNLYKKYKLFSNDVDEIFQNIDKKVLKIKQKINPLKKEQIKIKDKDYYFNQILQD